MIEMKQVKRKRRGEVLGVKVIHVELGMLTTNTLNIISR